MGKTVKDVMTRDVRACEPNATIREAAELMAREDVGPIPVVEDGPDDRVELDRLAAISSVNSRNR